MKNLPGANASVEEILERVRSLKGRFLREVLPSDVIIDKRNKGSVGNLIEHYGFGIENNSIAGPDFVKSEIELKVLPLKKTSKGLIIKERTKVCSINYKSLPLESWSSSHARLKLRSILFIFYIHEDDALDSLIKDYFLFEIGTDEGALRADWEKTVSFVRQGKAHLLSEGLTNYLAPSRSGLGGLDSEGRPRDLVPQFEDVEPLALRRAFSLKPYYTTSIFQERVLKKVFTPLSEIKFTGTEEDVVPFIIKKINGFKGVKLKEFARIHGLSMKKGKAKSAQLVRSALGLVGSHENVLEFNRLGIKFKTVPVHPKTLVPYEAMSFPVVPFIQVVREDFWNSDLIDQANNIIVIPLLRESRSSQGEDEKIGKAVYLNLDDEELELVREDYERYREFYTHLFDRFQSEGIDGALKYWEENFIRSSQTKIVHMRPHTTKGNFDDSIGALLKVKHSFWFNKAFIHQKISAELLNNGNC